MSGAGKFPGGKKKKLLWEQHGEPGWGTWGERGTARTKRSRALLQLPGGALKSHCPWAHPYKSSHWEREDGSWGFPPFQKAAGLPKRQGVS